MYVLMAMGLQISPSSKARLLLANYVQTWKVKTRATCTDRAGWHGSAYVLPDETIGENGERVLLQTIGEPPRLQQVGTVAEWRDNVARLCVGNSRLTFSVSMAFATPLLNLIGDESGGAHWTGGSSTGKTTALKLGSSVWGDPDQFLHRWRATGNGLEAIAQAHNDGLLVLDELAQVDPREAGEIAYMLANGKGKHRARRDGQARKAATWRLLFLSAGEIGLADHMRAAGKTSRAGQEVRLADVPADAGKGHGIFEELHGFISGAALAEHLNKAVEGHHGTAIRAYLRQLVQVPIEQLKKNVETLRSDFLTANVPEKADGQARRVASRFALIAAGGELATRFGLTGWPVGEAVEGAATCFKAWIDRRGGSGSQEITAALAQVRHFLEAHGESRFSDLGKPTDRPTINRAGYRRRTDLDKLEYLILPEVFRREICAGLDYRNVARALRDRGLLQTESPDRLTIKPRDLGRVYCVREGLENES
jgi:putative DNA primase/helicase